MQPQPLSTEGQMMNELLIDADSFEQMAGEAIRQALSSEGTEDEMTHFRAALDLLEEATDLRLAVALGA
jgi:hypothetical protein